MRCLHLHDVDHPSAYSLTRDPDSRLNPTSTELDRSLDQRDATLAGCSTEQVLASAAKLGAPDPARPYATSQALESQRDERL